MRDLFPYSFCYSVSCVAGGHHMSYSLPRHRCATRHYSASNIFFNQPSSWLYLLTHIVSFVLDHEIHRLTTELGTSLLA